MKELFGVIALLLGTGASGVAQSDGLAKASQGNSVTRYEEGDPRFLESQQAKIRAQAEQNRREYEENRASQSARIAARYQTEELVRLQLVACENLRRMGGLRGFLEKNKKEYYVVNGGGATAEELELVVAGAKRCVRLGLLPAE
jgi:hypothetical protein